MTMRPEPTLRAMIEPLRKCSIGGADKGPDGGCAFCYYRFEERQSIKPWAQVKDDIDRAKAEGNVALEISGGEPTEYPDLIRLLEYASGLDLSVRIISHLVVNPDKLRAICDSGKHWWLVSMHGTEAIHDRLVNLQGARKIQMRNLDIILECGNGFDTNTVINRQNQYDILDLFRLFAKIHPRIVNGINMNPHRSWNEHKECLDFIADLRVIRPQLDEGIRLLEREGIAVNLRYMPFCMIPAEFRKCGVNDSLVYFDSGEWGEGINPKTTERFIEHMTQLSAANEEKGEPCCRCDLKHICGGANKRWHVFSQQLDGEILEPQRVPELTNPKDWYFYRKHNERAMANYTNTWND